MSSGLRAASSQSTSRAWYCSFQIAHRLLDTPPNVSRETFAGSRRPAPVGLLDTLGVYPRGQPP